MTPDERIEALLNRANNTILDLPRPRDYMIAQRLMAAVTAVKWCGGPAERYSAQDELQRYCCHLADVIDRLEWALENTLQRLEQYEPQDLMED